MEHVSLSRSGPAPASTGNRSDRAVVQGIMRTMHPHPSSAGRPLASALLAIGLAIALGLGATACGHEDDPEQARDSASSDGTSAATASPAGSPSSSARPSYPTFTPEDYTYRLEVLCYCPLFGPVDVTVTDGKVTAAVAATGPGKGKPAPEVARRSINDLIAIANDPKVASVDVTWPTGQDHPDAIKVDQIEQAIDDEVTYTITNVVPASAG